MITLMRFGFFIGFLVGGVFSTLLGKKKAAEAPGTTVAPPAATDSIEGQAERAQEAAKGVIDELKQRLREAIEAGKEAAREKEESLRREYEATLQAPQDPRRFYRR